MLSLGARIFCLALGAAAIAWAVIWFPVFRQSMVLEDTAGRIIRGQVYKLETLLDLTPALDAVAEQRFCAAAGLRSAAIIRMRIAELAPEQANGADIDRSYARLRVALHKSLECSPVDAFLWLGLYWLEVNSNGFQPRHLDYLRMSYRQAPSEGWIMEKRNQLAIAVYPVLPPDLAELALSEFTRLMQLEFSNSAVNVLLGPGWPIRDVLLSRIEKVPLVQRKRFSDILKSRGVDIAIPGIENERRPWQ